MVRRAGEDENRAHDRQRITEALLRSEIDLRSLVENAPYGIYRSSLDGQLLQVNRALVEMLGYESEDELIGTNLSTDIYRDPAERVRLIDQYHVHESFEGIEVDWKRKDNTTTTVRLSGRPVRDEAGTILCFEVFVEDVAERRVMEAQLRHSQKMEAVGNLAGGVAHDFNNLLMVIRGYTELMMHSLPAEDPLRSHATQVMRAADQAITVTQQLLAFSRKQLTAPRVLDLNLILADMGKMLPHFIREDIELSVLPGQGLGMVKADPGQIEQIVMNLVVNARDAMPNGGKLTIETSNVVLDNDYTFSHAAVVPGNYVMLAVSDSGIGMDAETTTRIFEPFYTTKEKGRGTGLGLATVYGIVKQSGGYVWVYSEPNNGTSFKIYLLQVQGMVETGRPKPEHDTRYTGTETVLLVEDDDGVRGLTREYLQRIGHKVLETKNGAEAAHVAGEYPGPIHLMITDVVMPGIGGRELADSLATKRPDMKVLYVSGYTEDTIVDRGVLHPGTLFLPKPFAFDTLARKVHEALHAMNKPSQ